MEGQARHSATKMADKKNGGQAYIPNNPRWERFSKIKIGPKMKDFVGITDNDWFA